MMLSNSLDSKLRDNTINPCNNLEYDLLSCEWMCEKVRNSETYGQNLYAALCNNSFVPIHIFEILKDVEWACSWRYAGSIIADMNEKGDYMDWYCSGMFSTNEETGSDLDKRFVVEEGTITSEIKNDLNTLGWQSKKSILKE
jgi:hypothetical protein